MSGRSLLQMAIDADQHVKPEPGRIHNPDHLPPYWRELGYYEISNGIFKRVVASGPAPIVVCAEKFHSNRRTNLARLAAIKRGFCGACGASIPHRPGEGRCPECKHHQRSV